MFSKHQPPLYLSDFYEKRTVKDDNWNIIKNGEITLEYFKDKDDIKPVAMIRFRPGVGQIGIIGIWEKSYRRKGLGKQMLAKAINEIDEWGMVDTVWAISTKDHPFWSNVFNKAFVYKSLANYNCGYYYKFKY